jgi:hypothetical protein
MVKELQAHYLDLVCQAVDAGGNAPLLHRLDEHNGVIYATRSETDTRAEYAVLFKFNGDGVALVVNFVDARPQVKVQHTYLDGIGAFFELFMKALKANRLEDRRAA